MKRKVQNLSERTRVLGNQSVRHKQFAEFSESLAAKAVQRFGFVYVDEDEKEAKTEEAPKPAPKRKPRPKAEPKLEDRV